MLEVRFALAEMVEVVKANLNYWRLIFAYRLFSQLKMRRRRLACLSVDEFPDSGFEFFIAVFGLFVDS